MLKFDSKGIYCEQAGIYIDPWLPVDKALITHAHSDHARPGSKFYMCNDNTVTLLRLHFITESTFGLPIKKYWKSMPGSKKIQLINSGRCVKGTLVFGPAFEGINFSPRHKSGVALRFPHILWWRKDKSATEANTKEDLLQLIAAQHS